MFKPEGDRYALGNPVRYTDPDGRWIVGAVIGGVLGGVGYHLTAPPGQRTVAGYAANIGLGAISGGLISSLRVAAVAGAALGGFSYRITTPSTQRTFTGYMVSAAVGAAFGFAGTALANRVSTGRWGRW